MIELYNIYFQNTLTDLNKIDYKLEDLTLMLNELQPRERAESEIAYLDQQQREQQSSLSNLISDIDAEVKDEISLNEEITQFVSDIREALDSVPTLSAEDARLLHDGAIPHLRSKLNSIVDRRADSASNRLYTLQVWPNNLESPSDITLLINQLEKSALKQIESAEIVGRQQELDLEYLKLMPEVERLLQKYSNGIPQSIETVREDSDLIDSLLKRLRPLCEQLQNYLDWLAQRSNVESSDDKLKETKNALRDLTHLHAQMQQELRDHSNLKHQKDILTQRFDQLQTEASKAHEVEDPDQRHTQLLTVQQQMQPLVEELYLVRQQLPEKERPILSDNLENTQLLRRLHDDALSLQDVLGSDQQDAAKRLRLSRIEHETHLALSLISDKISAAELLLNVDGTPSMSQLREAALKLDTLPEQITAVPKIYEDLSDEDEMSRQLKVGLNLIILFYISF